MHNGSCYDLISFGSYMQKLRNQKKYTQQKIQNISGIHPQTIKKIEYGLTLPTLDTLDRLSHVYNINLANVLETYRMNDIAHYDEILNRIDKYSMSNALEKLDDIIFLLKQELSKTDRVTNEYHQKKLHQIIHFAEIVKLKNKTDILSVRSTECLCFKALKYFHPTCSIDTIESYFFDHLEVRILIALGCSYLRQEKASLGISIIKVAIKNILSELNGNVFPVDLLILSYCMLSDAYFMIDKHHDSIEVATTAIKLSMENYCIKYLPQLYFRKGISEYHMNHNDYHSSLKASMTILELTGDMNQKAMFLDSLKEDYNITLHD